MSSRAGFRGEGPFERLSTLCAASETSQGDRLGRAARPPEMGVRRRRYGGPRSLIECHDVRATPSEQGRNGPADSRAASRNNRNLAAEGKQIIAGVKYTLPPKSQQNHLYFTGKALMWAGSFRTRLPAGPKDPPYVQCGDTGAERLAETLKTGRCKLGPRSELRSGR